MSTEACARADTGATGVSAWSGWAASPRSRSG